MAAGDQQAFTHLYRRYWKGLYMAAAKALRDRDAAADIVQDIFLSLWNRRTELQVEGSLAAYLQTSVRYKVIHFIERNIVRHDYVSQLSNIESSAMPPVAEIRLQLKDAQLIIHQTVSRMPPKMQEVYKLSREEHLSHKEIADKMGISSETSKKHIQHAMKLIKLALGQTASTASILAGFLLLKK
ncbi:putative RNA polymerase ECF-type sigma factor [Flavihumibacter petaseus NBRC 106054]|uniref:Putative RNA polymerase ECF-type sigma factor n=2 Tax=Flavihumibacter TaxID=1004301 RepID=A0A0E9N0T1_9BACT|nr:putative RNA polymerase ECF-type sigma factor [Flavihumibacter petaseus NBRC 106054]